jgi:ClpP class serine protease
MNKLKTILKGIADKTKSDFYLFSSTVNGVTADNLIKEIRRNKTREKNCSLILTTFGGDADAGYRIVRTIKRKYKKLTLYLFGTCKSTGTLIALGADEIVMGDFAELGPLDIQLAKEDELSNTSGLNYIQSLMY